MNEGLWPEDLGSLKIRPPVSILKEQASILGTKTNNLVEGLVSEVFSVVDEDVEQRMEYSFNLVAPALGGYRYRLFTIDHDIRMYPLDINLESEILAEVAPDQYSKWPTKSLPSKYKYPIKADDEAKFIELLKRIFSATKTKQIIAAIIAQSTS